MTSEQIWAPWLRDDRITFRPPVRGDAAEAYRWHEGDPPPMAHRVLAELEASETVPWGQANTVRMIVGDTATGETVGGVVVRRGWQSVDGLSITPSRSLDVADRVDMECRVLRLLTPWLIDDIGIRSIVFQTDATRSHLIDTATSLGYDHAFTYREYAFRDGRFVDVLGFQLLNARWSLALAGEATDD